MTEHLEIHYLFYHASLDQRTVVNKDNNYIELIDERTRSCDGPYLRANNANRRAALASQFVDLEAARPFLGHPFPKRLKRIAIICRKTEGHLLDFPATRTVMDPCSASSRST